MSLARRVHGRLRLLDALRTGRRARHRPLRPHTGHRVAGSRTATATPLATCPLGAPMPVPPTLREAIDGGRPPLPQSADRRAARRPGGEPVGREVARPALRRRRRDAAVRPGRRRDGGSGRSARRGRASGSPSTPCATISAGPAAPNTSGTAPAAIASTTAMPKCSKRSRVASRVLAEPAAVPVDRRRRRAAAATSVARALTCTSIGQPERRPPDGQGVVAVGRVAAADERQPPPGERPASLERLDQLELLLAVAEPRVEEPADDEDQRALWHRAATARADRRVEHLGGRRPTAARSSRR